MSVTSTQALYRVVQGAQAAVVVPLPFLARAQGQSLMPVQAQAPVRLNRPHSRQDGIILDFYCEYPGCAASAEVGTTLDLEKSALPAGWSCLWVWTPAMAEPIEFELCREHASLAIQPWMLEAPPQSIGRIAEQLDVQNVVPLHEDDAVEDVEESDEAGLDGDSDDYGFGIAISASGGASWDGADEEEAVIGDPEVVVEPLIAFFGDDEDEVEAPSL